MKRQLPAWMLGGPIKSCEKDIEDGQAVKEPKQIKKRKQSSRDSLDDDIGCERVEKERKGPKNKRDQMAKIEEKGIECENKETVEPLNSVQGKPPRFPLVKCKERKVTKENVSSYGEEIKNKRDQTAKIEEKAIECEHKETLDEPMFSVQGKPPRFPLVKCKERKVTKENVSSYGEEIKKKMNRIENPRDVASMDCLDNEDDFDLTVEDLTIIANEYIEEDNNNSKQVEISKEEHKSVSQSQRITDSSRSPVTCNSDVVDLTQNGSSFDSENPTQSMLDLFLGPWLKKPQEEEKKYTSKTSDLNFEFEAYKQKSVPVAEKPLTKTTTTTTTTAPFGKKKSSLKDKVSMFLD